MSSLGLGVCLVVSNGLRRASGAIGWILAMDTSCFVVHVLALSKLTLFDRLMSPEWGADRIGRGRDCTGVV